jgi:hypothetical protein
MADHHDPLPPEEFAGNLVAGCDLGFLFGRRAMLERSRIDSRGVTTALRWYADLVKRRWTYKRTHPGRPPTRPIIRELVLRMAAENPGWAAGGLPEHWPISVGGSRR